MHTFILSIAALALLTGCGTKSEVPSRVVKVFEGVAPPTSTGLDDSIKEDETCVWKAQTVSVFNQKAQTISFKYISCDGFNPIEFTVKNGHDIYLILDKVEKPSSLEPSELDIHVLTVRKTGPLTDQEFMQSLIPEGEKSQEYCQAVHLPNKHWAIIVKDGSPHDFDNNSWVMYPPLSTDRQICGIYRWDRFDGFEFGMADGIAIGYNRQVEQFQMIDLSTITYENKG